MKKLLELKNLVVQKVKEHPVETGVVCGLVVLVLCLAFC